MSARYLSAQLGAAFLPAVGTVIDTGAPEWSGAASAAGIRPGVYAVAAHSIKATGAPSVVLTPGDAITAARQTLATAERAVANLTDPAWIAAETTRRGVKVTAARAALAALTGAPPAPAPVSDERRAAMAAPAPAAPVAPAPAGGQDVAAIVAAVIAAMAGGQA